MQQHHIKGHITGADGGYIVKGERYIPDIGFISVERQPESSHDTYNPVHPDLAVEVVSPTDGERNLAIKIANYVAAGTVVWLPRRQRSQYLHPRRSRPTLIRK